MAMPVVQFERLEQKVYKSGYFTNTDSEQVSSKTTPLENRQHRDRPVELEVETDVEQLPVSIAPPASIICMELPKTPSPVENLSNDTPVHFPKAAKVCETSLESELAEFNPLNDSEPNLEFNMMSQNNEPDLHVKLIKDAKTHKWQVNIRNLTKEQIKFIAGPGLLPTLGKADAIVIKHDQKDGNNMPTLLEQSKETTETTKTRETIESPVTGNDNKLDHEPDKPALPDTNNITTGGRPSRLATKNINYAAMVLPEEISEAESEEFNPNPLPTPKLKNKRCPIVTRIAAQ